LPVAGSTLTICTAPFSVRTATNSVPSGAAAIPVGSSQPIPPSTMRSVLATTSMA